MKNMNMMSINFGLFGHPEMMKELFSEIFHFVAFVLRFDSHKTAI